MSPQALASLLACLMGVYLTPALAGGVPTVPPAHYDHPHPDMLVIERSPAEVDRICRAIGAHSRSNSRIVACAPIGKARCAIVIPVSHPQKAALVRHERGHCNGWPADHPR